MQNIPQVSISNSLIMHRMTIIERMNGLLGNNLVKELILK
jgi:hypothetical protein